MKGKASGSVYSDKFCIKSAEYCINDVLFLYVDKQEYVNAEGIVGLS